jgi:DNA-binding NarL/FixJ family response regulator
LNSVRTKSQSALEAVVHSNQNGSKHPTTKILIALEDHLLRSLLTERLSLEESFQILGGGVSSGNELRSALDAQRPDVLVLDLQWSGFSGLHLLEQISDQPDRPLILAIGGEENPEAQLMAARAGARGFVSKSQGSTVLCEAIRIVRTGGVYFERQVSERVFDEYHRLSRRVREQDNPAHSLSDREREVLVCMADGLTNKEIADQLYMSIHTVKLHVQKIFRKLDIPNRTEAAVFAVREGLVSASN